MKFLILGIIILFVVFLFTSVNDQLVAVVLPSLLVVCSVLWGARAYSVALDKIKNAITPACSGAETAAVLFLTADSNGWRFRFFNRAYAEQFAAQNVSRPVTSL